MRASLIGLNVYVLRLTAFVMAGFLAGVAGALFAFFGRYASASYMFYNVSGEAVVWAIVGGAGTLFGPFIGTTLFIVIRELVSTHWEHHSLIVGMMAILVVIFAPQRHRRALARLDRRASAAPAKPARSSRGQIADRAMSEPVLRTENLTKRFGGLTAVDNLSLSLPGGRLHAIIGPNGAGKTTLLQPRLGPAEARQRPGVLSAAAISPD